MGYPQLRMRRLRSDERIRRLVRENRLVPENFIYPVFVREDITVQQAIPSMPGCFQYPLSDLPALATQISESGIAGVILFGIPIAKDAVGSSAYQAGGVVPEAIRLIKAAAPDLLVIADVCLCEYTDHGHCGPLNAKGCVDNDAALPLLAQAALVYAQAGADMVAPSDMMDGRIGFIRATLDQAGFTDTIIMSYAVKYASAFYGPFREAADSAPSSGDRCGYQMDPANRAEALREVALDIAEGADIVMVKPGMPYLDILTAVKQEFSYPTAAYQVSGEYALIKAAGQLGYIDEDRVLMESLLGFKRAGADFIITYGALKAAELLRTQKS